jgi:DNA-binding response OmpR family regulator
MYHQEGDFVKVLLVDDEVEFASTLTERLNLRGMETHCAYTANDALALSKQHAFDLAVLDVKMPQISGLELANRLGETHPGMKFIFLTGHTSENDFEKGLRTGAFYLLKPVSIDVLINKIREASSEEKGNGQ